MHERKRGTLKSGRSGKKVTSRKQAIAIGLSEARERGAKVPKKKSAKKKTARKKTSRKSTGRKKTAGRKKSAGRKRSSSR
jgi:topoisomerase IA-like protein